MTQNEGDFTFRQHYLRCEDGACAPREPPPGPTDESMPCTGATFPDDEQGVVETELCTEGVCAFVRDDSCLATGCTRRCEFDSDCGGDSRCHRPALSEPDASGERTPKGPGVCAPLDGFGSLTRCEGG